MNKEQVYEMFRQVSSELAETLIKKNHDYGDSFHKVYEQFGDVSTYIRLSDKLGRLENLTKQITMRVEDESIEDAYRDIAGYCILTLVSRIRLNDEKKSCASEDPTVMPGTIIQCGQCQDNILITGTGTYFCGNCKTGHVISTGRNGEIFIDPTNIKDCR